MEDEWAVRLELADALECCGWTVVEISSGEEALRLLSGRERFTLIVTDIRLEGAVTGWDVAEAYRAADPDVAIVYASGNPVIEERRTPGSVFLSKPVLVDQLMAICNELGERPKRSEA